MNTRLSPLATAALAVAAGALMPGRSWAVFYPLGPSNNEWGMKYDVEVNAATGDVLNVAFTLADAGRLKPIYSVTVVAFSKPDNYGGRTYLVEAPIKFKRTKGGKLAGQVQIRKEFEDIAVIRILTLTVDGRRQTAGARYYDIPLKKFLNKPSGATSSPTPSSISAPPASKVAR
jgi:hypothetical protein